MINLASLPYIIMDIKMRSVVKTTLPKWFASTVRGALGTELFSAFCTKNEICCDTCEKKCSAGLLFSTASPDKSDEAVNPYTVSCGDFDGCELTFRITLFSEGVKAVGDLIKVLRCGLFLGADRTRFDLVSVTDRDTGNSIFDGVIQTEPEIHYFVPEEEKATRIRVDYITPYKTKISAEKFGFEQLVRAVLRRASTVYRQTGTEPELNYSEIISRAAEISCEDRKYIINKTQRYSNRSASKMDVTGFTGYSIYRGSISEFMPLLRLSEIIHSGKLCVMGLGEIRVTVIEQTTG